MDDTSGGGVQAADKSIGQENISLSESEQQAKEEDIEDSKDTELNMNTQTNDGKSDTKEVDSEESQKSKDIDIENATCTTKVETYDAKTEIKPKERVDWENIDLDVDQAEFDAKIDELLNSEWEEDNEEDTNVDLQKKDKDAKVPDQSVFITVSLEETCSLCHLDTEEVLERCLICCGSSTKADENDEKPRPHPPRVRAHKACFIKDHDIIRQTETSRSATSFLISPIEMLSCIVSPCVSPYTRRRREKCTSAAVRDRSASRGSSCKSSAQISPASSPKSSPQRKVEKSAHNENKFSTYGQMHRSVSLHTFGEQRVPVYSPNVWERQLSLGSGHFGESKSSHHLWSLGNDAGRDKENRKDTDIYDDTNSEKVKFSIGGSGSREDVHHQHNVPKKTHNVLSASALLASSHNALPSTEEEEVESTVTTAKLYNLKTGRRRSLSHDSLATMTVSRI